MPLTAVTTHLARPQIDAVAPNSMAARNKAHKKLMAEFDEITVCIQACERPRRAAILLWC